MSLFEQRQAFSSLRAIKAGKKVGSIRTGHRVREHFPGTIPQISSTIHHTRPNSRIQIYQDDMSSEMKISSILDHVPVEIQYIKKIQLNLVHGIVEVNDVH